MLCPYKPPPTLLRAAQEVGGMDSVRQQSEDWVQRPATLCHRSIWTVPWGCEERGHMGPGPPWSFLDGSQGHRYSLGPGAGRAGGGGPQAGPWPLWDRDGVRKDQRGGHMSSIPTEGQSSMSWLLAIGYPCPQAIRKQSQQSFLSGGLLICHSGSPPISYLFAPGQGPPELLHPMASSPLCKWCPGAGSPHPASVLLCSGMWSFDHYLVIYTHCPLSL